MRRALFYAAILLVALVAVLIRLRGPAPAPTTAAPDTFSAQRAQAILSTLLAENVPHPIGTEANRRVRDRITARFNTLGYRTTIQRRFICSAAMTCATVENIIARRPDNRGRPAVAVVTHYDSVAAGPGASDAGVHVAAMLEVARATRIESFRNDIVFLVTDGEEAALLGADAFLADPAESANVTTVINFEDRGTSGPSFLFETSRNNRWLISAARKLRRPAATSLFYTVYENLPNDTDVTIFKAAGKAAVNFAAIGDVVYYHTPLDDLRHVDLRTMQHHGQNMLDMLRSLGNVELRTSATGNATYFDVLNFFLLSWPEWVSILLAAIGVFATAAAMVQRRSAGGSGAALFLLGVLLAALFGAFSFFLLRTPRWIASTELAAASAWLGGLTAAALAIRLARPDERSILGMALCWNVVGLGLVLTLPGASYLFIVPGLLLAAACFYPLMQGVACAIAAILFFPFAVVLYAALGAPALIGIALVVTLVLTTTVDAFAGIPWKGVIAVAVVMIVSTVPARLLPPWTAERPRRHSIDYVLDATTGRAYWISNVPMTGFAPSSSRWRRRENWEAPAPTRFLPRLDVRSERAPGGVRLHIRSKRNANRISIAVETAEIVSGLRINGVAASPRRSRWAASNRSAPTGATIYGDEALVEIRTRTADPISVLIRESTYGLPPIASSLVAERSKQHGVTTYEGDLTVMTQRVTIP